MAILSALERTRLEDSISVLAVSRCCFSSSFEDAILPDVLEFVTDAMKLNESVFMAQLNLLYVFLHSERSSCSE